jgi:peroxiredoxin Q/BCP
MKILYATLLTAAISATLSGQAVTPPKTRLKVGDKAPDFTLTGTDGKKYTLSSFQGKKAVVLAFFPAAFTGG